MDQQTFEDSEPAASVLFEAGTSSVLFEAGAMDDSFDAGTSDDPFADSAATPVDIYTDDSEASTIEIIYGRPAGTTLPRSFASSMLERCDDNLDVSRGLLTSGSRRDEATPLTTKVEVLNQDLIQSEFFVTEPAMKPQFAAVQVEFY